MSFMNFVLIVNCVTSESGAPRFTPSLITSVSVMKVALKDDLNQYFANQVDNPTIKFAFYSRNISYIFDWQQIPYFNRCWGNIKKN